MSDWNAIAKDVVDRAIAIGENNERRRIRLAAIALSQAGVVQLNDLLVLTAPTVPGAAAGSAAAPETAAAAMQSGGSPERSGLV